MKLEEAVMRLRSYPEFQIVMEGAAEMRPYLFPLDPKQDWDQQTARAMYQSGQLAGWDLLYEYLRGTHGKPRAGTTNAG